MNRTLAHLEHDLKMTVRMLGKDHATAKSLACLYLEAKNIDPWRVYPIFPKTEPFVMNDPPETVTLRKEYEWERLLNQIAEQVK